MFIEDQRNGRGDGVRGRDAIELIPYTELDGAWSVPDSLVRVAWAQLERDGLVPTVFPGADIADADDFLEFFKLPGILPVFFAAEDKLLGFAWLSNIAHNSAWANFACFKASWGKHTIASGEKVIGYWFGLGPIEVLVGTTPASNRKALAFIRKLGFTSIGTIPRIAHGGDGMVISYLERP